MDLNLISTILVYAGLLAVLVGSLSLLRPLSFLGIWSRVQGLILLGCGIVVFVIGARLPAPEQRVAIPVTHLDEFIPAYQFEEFHSIPIQAPRERVYAAIRDVTADEISLFQTLTWIRRFGQPGPESILNAPPDKPLLDVALHNGFLKLAEEPNREMVLGTLEAAPKGAQLKKNPTPEDFKALQAPLPPTTKPPSPQSSGEKAEADETGKAGEAGKEGEADDGQPSEAKQKSDAKNAEATAQSSPRSGFALAAINFRLEDAGSGETLLTTETRVFATDASTRKKFAAYWRVIYPGSALIRVMWLRAIKQRAETKQGSNEETKSGTKGSKETPERPPTRKRPAAAPR